MKRLTRIKKELTKSITVKASNDNKNINQHHPPQQLSQNKEHTQKLSSQNKKSLPVTWKNQKINPAATFPSSSSKYTQISNETSPKNKRSNFKQESKALPTPIEVKQSSEDLKDSRGNHQIKEEAKAEDDNKSLIQHLLSMVNNLQPQLDNFSKEEAIGRDSPNQFFRAHLNSISSEDSKQSHEQSIDSLANKRKATYSKYFDLLFKTLEDIKVLCNTQMMTKPTSHEETNNIQCDIDDSQLKEKSHLIKPIGNAVKDSIQSMLISSLYSEFYQEIINNKQENQIANITLSTVVKENIALTNRLKADQERLRKKARRNNNMPHMLLPQQTSVMNMSNNSTIKMIDEDNTGFIEYNHPNHASPIIKLPFSIKSKPEHKHTKSIQNNSRKDHCVII